MYPKARVGVGTTGLEGLHVDLVVREENAARRILGSSERLAVQDGSERHQRTASMDDINSFSVVRFDGHRGVRIHGVV